MATALETSSQPQASRPPAGLVAASLIGAVYVLASLAVVLYAVPAIWSQVAGDTFRYIDIDPGRTLAQLVAVFALAWFGSVLAGANPPLGLRGGVFLMVLAVAIIALIVLWVGMAGEGLPAQIATGVVAVALIFGAVKLFTSPRGERWMVSLESQGWFRTRSYKRVLGLKVRRLTLLGFLLLGASGIYALYSQSSLPDNWTVSIPFTQKAGAPDGTPKTFTLLTDARYTIPILLMLLTVWMAYRAVNVPTFAEFLIATEAEMNKVSWTSKRRLAQDTVVVLITTILMALFLLVMDMFWGWLLSKVGVLPPKADKHKEVMEQKW